ncbi:hypothetical protein C7441_11042 [Pseudaminobacter salicylatoxidans]|uniref:Uncharacterized protein n=1 Tax=Pseudaminobacter salicylatoxidans TaxID=93369 RepID=A0A316C0I1_PSESE|nr:hypothetical protein [Pseudaminobacter salicylatoxidans]PWJ81510.1 hypothetical protein C7441_11042 [Pseudaminobacter salicylatoxidans]
MADTTKAEEQIAKDKEAVKAMTGAKAAMEATLRRIAILEQAISAVRRECQIAAKTYGDGVHIRVYNYKTNQHEVVKATEFFDRIDNTIKAVL